MFLVFRKLLGCYHQNIFEWDFYFLFCLACMRTPLPPWPSGNLLTPHCRHLPYLGLGAPTLLSGVGAPTPVWGGIHTATAAGAGLLPAAELAGTRWRCCTPLFWFAIGSGCGDAQGLCVVKNRQREAVLSGASLCTRTLSHSRLCFLSTLGPNFSIRCLSGSSEPSSLGALVSLSSLSSFPRWFHHFLLSPLQSDWFFSDSEDKGERVSDAEGPWGGVRLVVGPHPRWVGWAGSLKQKVPALRTSQSVGGSIGPLLRSLQSDGRYSPHFHEPQVWGGDRGHALRNLSPVEKTDPALQSYEEDRGLRKVQSNGGDTDPTLSGGSSWAFRVQPRCWGGRDM